MTKTQVNPTQANEGVAPPKVVVLATRTPDGLPRLVPVGQMEDGYLFIGIPLRLSDKHLVDGYELQKLQTIAYAGIVCIPGFCNPPGPKPQPPGPPHLDNRTLINFNIQLDQGTMVIDVLAGH